MEQRVIRMKEAVSNHQFQDWLLTNYIMTRQNVTRQDLESKEKSLSGNQYADKIMALLSVNVGYLVSTSEIYHHIYGSQPREGDSLISSWMHEIRTRKLVNPDTLLSVRGIGWSFGVSALHVSKESFLLVYRLWKELLKNVDEVSLSKSVYGYDDLSAILSVRRQTSKLNTKELQKTTARIAIEKINDDMRNYRLVHTSDLPERKIRKENTWKPNQPAYLQHDFQDWLSKIGLLSRHELYIDPTVSSFDPARKDHTLLRVLFDNYGYLVPYASLSQILYGKANKVKETREIFSYLKDKQVLSSKDVIAVPEVGIGLGILCIPLSKKQLQLLRLLWRNKSGGSSRLLTRKIYGIYDEETKKNLMSLAYRTRSLLESTNYRITTRKEITDFVYTLEKQKDS